MVIEIDFQSDEALYTQLMNQIIMGICGASKNDETVIINILLLS